MGPVGDGHLTDCTRQTVECRENSRPTDGTQRDPAAAGQAPVGIGAGGREVAGKSLAISRSSVSKWIGLTRWAAYPAAALARAGSTSPKPVSVMPWVSPLPA